MARPVKYGNPEARKAARRVQNKVNGEAWRAKQRALKSSTMIEVRQRDESHTDRALVVAEAQYTARSVADLCREIDRHSISAPIDLSFGTIDAVVDGLSKVATGWPWKMSLSPAIQRGDRLVEMAVMAAGCQTMGRMRHDANMISVSFRAYQNILQQLQQRLSGVAGSLLPGPVLNTIELACAGVEVLENCSTTVSQTSNTTWLVHYRSCISTFQRAGPRAYKTNFGLQVLRAMKSKIMFIAMYDRKRIFLDAEQWRVVTHGGDVKDELWHLLERVPGCLQRADQLVLHGYATPSGETEAESLWDDLMQLRTDLRQWKTSIFMMHSISELPLVASTTVLLCGARSLFGVVPYRYVFPNAVFGDLMTIYWYFEMRIIKICLTVQDIMIGTGFLSRDSNLKYFTEFDMEGPARDICRAMEYMYTRDSFENEMFYYPATLPLRTAMYHYACQANKQDEVKWCDAVTKSITHIDIRTLMSELYIDTLHGPVNETWKRGSLSMQGYNFL
jgi:hypothetical protein